MSDIERMLRDAVEPELLAQVERLEKMRKSGAEQRHVTEERVKLTIREAKIRLLLDLEVE